MGKRITMIRLGTYSGYLKTEVGKALLRQSLNEIDSALARGSTEVTRA
jgi:hypothetical protein